METESDNILSDDFELIGPIQARPRHQTPFGLGDTNIGSQYNNCLSGGARGKVLVYHLVHKSSATPVGFIGLEMATEELDAGDPVNGGCVRMTCRRAGSATISFKSLPHRSCIMLS